MQPSPAGSIVPRSPSLLSPSAFDDDASSIRSHSDQDSDSEDDLILNRSRSTLELSRHDKTVLDAEDELERLLTKKSPSDGIKRMFGVRDDGVGTSTVRIGKQEKRRPSKRRRRGSHRKSGDMAGQGESDGLMYEMEEGIVWDDDSGSWTSSTPTSDSDSPTAPGNVYSGVGIVKSPIVGPIADDFSCIVEAVIVWKARLHIHRNPRTLSHPLPGCV